MDSPTFMFNTAATIQHTDTCCVLFAAASVLAWPCLIDVTLFYTIVSM